MTKTVLTLFGTRPEVIKLAPVIRRLEADTRTFRTVNITSAQHMDLIYPLIRSFGLRVDHDLQLMEADQVPNRVCGRMLASLDPILAQEMPDLMLVQGDTTTAMAGALAGFHRSIPVGHIEAGLRSGNLHSPYPEEMNRTLISRLATYHFAATHGNRDTLVSEGVAVERIFVTGNPVVDSLLDILERAQVTPAVEELLRVTTGLKRIVLTTHRRESFGKAIGENLTVLRGFVERYLDVAVIFPVHPNEAVVEPARRILSAHPRIVLTQPLSYEDFIVLLSHAWLIVSDSGGLQEEAPTLGKPLLILRENTERPEVLDSGVAVLVGGQPGRLAALLEAARQEGGWADQAKKTQNPFGRGDSGKRIVEAIAGALALS